MTAHPVPLSRLHALRAELVREQDKALANFNALGGGIQVVDKLIAEATGATPAPAPVGSPANNSSP